MIQSVLLTGAAGALGKIMRPFLVRRFVKVRLSDISPIEAGTDGAEIVPCDLCDAQGVTRLVEGMDAVIHFGGSLSRNDWTSIRDTNIDGTFNIYEAARLGQVLRIIYASSNHVIGMYPREEPLGLDAPLRPDSLYGVSKCFGEALSRYYWDKYGLESACLRIGSALPEPVDERGLATWLSYADLEQAVMRCLTIPFLGWTTLYGVSDNDRLWWDNSAARHLGYRPRDNAEIYAGKVLPGSRPLEPNDPALRFQGGARSGHDYVEAADRPAQRRLRQEKP